MIFNLEIIFYCMSKNDPQYFIFEICSQCYLNRFSAIKSKGVIVKKFYFFLQIKKNKTSFNHIFIFDIFLIQTSCNVHFYQ